MIRSFLNFKISWGYKKKTLSCTFNDKTYRTESSFSFFSGQKLDVNEES